MVTAAQLRWSHELHEGQQLLCRHNREESDPLLGMPDHTSLGTSGQWSARSLIGDVADDFAGCRIKYMRTIGIYPQLDV
jgi:hypothetical protein